MGFELLLLSLPLSDRQVAVLRTVIFAHSTGSVTARQAKRLGRRAVGCELVRGDRLGVNALMLQQFSEQLQSSVLAAALLNQNVEHLAFVVNGALQVHAPPADLADHFVQMPSAGRGGAPAAKIGGDERPKLVHPAADRLAADRDPAPRHHFLNVAKAQCEAEIEPDGVPEHLHLETGDA